MFMLMIYFMVQMAALRFKVFKKMQTFLKSKLFYNVWIRYLIASNLKVTHNSMFYLHIAGDFIGSADTRLMTAIYAILLAVTILWPILMTSLLFTSR